MSDHKSKRKALKKADVKKMVTALQKRGFHIYSTLEYVNVWTDRTDDMELVGRFRWVSKRRAWCFEAPRLHLHTVADFKQALAEMTNDRAAAVKVEKDWDHYKNSRSEGNWLRYVGATAAAYLRDEDHEDLGDPE